MFKLYKRDELVSVCNTFNSAQVMAKRYANPTYHSTFTIRAPRGASYRARLVQGERAPGAGPVTDGVMQDKGPGSRGGPFPQNSPL
jgi:hypothetical protein